MVLKQLRLAQLVLDPRCQARARFREDYAEHLADCLRAKIKLPPPVVFQDGRTYYLADGFHRRRAYELNDALALWCDVRPGTVRDAILYAVAANLEHGLRVEPEDKRRGARILLEDAEWSQWSNREIARRCGCSPGLVAVVREELSAHVERIRCERDGTEYEMDAGETDVRAIRLARVEKLVGRLRELTAKLGGRADETAQAQAHLDDFLDIARGLGEGGSAAA